MNPKVALLMVLSTMPLSPMQNAKIRKIEGRLMAPCCYTQTILEHESQVAEQMREEVTAMVVSGKSEQEIVTYYKTKYGETILVVPDGAAGSLTYGMPVAALAISSGVLFFFIRRSLRANTVATEAIPPQGSERELEAIRKRIENELDEEWR
jgi:cytochrome c-type biogenesis protein CcmH